MSVNHGNSDRKPRRNPHPNGEGPRPIRPFPTGQGHGSGPPIELVPPSLPQTKGPQIKEPQIREPQIKEPQTKEIEPSAAAITQDFPPSFTDPFRDRPPRPRRAVPPKRGFVARLLRSLRRLLAACKNGILRLVSTWQFAITAAFLACVGASSLAIAFIIQLPALPNCPAVFWPLASASMRFECARIAASKQTAKDLLEAITLVDGLPPDHAMRPEADRMIELWSGEVLKLADELFHQGKLEDAIAAARKIPAKVTAYRLVEARVKTWETTWAEAEKIYQQAEAALRKRDWRNAFEQAVGLLDINNKYWQTTRYDDLNKRINTARADGNKLFKAEWLADQGDLASLKQAITLAQEIRPDSYIYALAQVKIQAFGRQMLNLAQKSLDRQNLQEALSIISQIPAVAKVESEKRDLTILANAQSHIWEDTVAGLEEAITQAQRILPGRPYYQKAQSLVTRWQYEIEGLAQIERARLLAQDGTIEALQAAIAAAAQVRSMNPRWDEAQREIQKWQGTIQTIADRPFLDQAEQLASYGDLNSLQAAVNQASQIASGRSLHREAQQKVDQWTRQIQQIQDQPYLEQARSYAFAGNLQAAIEMAGRIQPGRTLYNEAQAEMAKWRGQVQAQVEQVQTQVNQAQAQRNLQTARQLASTGTVNGIANAIQVANQVAAEGAIQSEINAAVNEWSWQLLQLAKDQANTLNLAGAIATAQRIPPRTAAHAQAQAQIQQWQLGRQ
ncbi:MAG: hypothetical protein NW220_02705 [Leptolyngbyaceae cyanobacterium bins.349]|nr:hypothetical protein [Leptolyngbyaceae cyanobacterium bins.349]